MRGAAFCPAHVTGFFRADEDPTGSVGAGFSTRKGVVTSVQTAEHDAVRPGIIQYVLDEFRRMTGDQTPVHIRHKLDIPPGYGLGASGALALSTLYALDAALGTRVPPQRLGMTAHNAEIRHRSGLGDVLAAYHGGFEIRVRAGGPGEGVIHAVDVGDPAVVIVCLSPLSTSTFLRERAGVMNGIGGRMVEELDGRRDLSTFQSLSMDFARRLGTITPQMDHIIRILQKAGYPCGVAMLGGTVFSMVGAGEADRIMEMMRPYGPILTGIDYEGARAL